MSGSLNRASLLGNLGASPDVRSLQDGTKVANLSIATSESWKDDRGDKVERTEWHRVVIFGALAEVAERWLKKGSKVFVEGQLQTRKWQKDGEDRYSTEIVVRGYGGRFVMLGDPKGQS